jgi:ribosomal protein S18 acetylase RimI-like enzyme
LALGQRLLPRGGEGEKLVLAMKIRSCQASDEPDVVRLWEACGLTRAWNDPRKDIARKLTVQPELFLVGVQDNAIVATAMGGYDGHRGWVNYLAVAPAHRRRGLGRLMMERIEAMLLAMGCPKLNLQIRTSNAEVQAFYERLGYTQEQRISLGKRLIADA